MKNAAGSDRADSGAGGARRQPTQRDVADRAGVSTATVSYVLSGRSNRARPVPEQTRERVLAAVEALGYRLNRSGRRLRRQRTELIALVYEPPSSPWIDPVAECAEDLAESRGYAVIHLPVRDAAAARRATQMLADGLVDGALVVSSRLIGTTALSRLAASGLAIVAHHETMRPIGLDVVRHGESAASADAVRYLLDQGRRRIAFMATEADRSRRSARFDGYLRALSEHGIPADEHQVIRTGTYRDSMYSAVLDVLRSVSGPRPDAVLSSTDRGAIAALWAARNEGVDVPGELAIIGMGNTTEGEMVRPSLTSIGTMDRRYTQANQRLIDRIDDPTLPAEQLAAPWVLTVRESA
ncbi:MAG: LacI family DNA-binding transcriptional regulator [bacterium]